MKAAYNIEMIEMTPEEMKKFLEGARKFAQIEHDPEDDQVVRPADNSE